MKDETRAAIIEHAKSLYPRESCGLILNIRGKESYKPCKNIAENDHDFIMDPVDFAQAEDSGQILAVVHSHCNQTAKPSQADLVGCEETNLPWIIYALPSDTWHEFSPNGYKAPLYGRTYAFGVLDCYTFIQDYYRETFQIELPHIERSEYFWKRGHDLYGESYGPAGFYRVEGDPIPGDLLIMQVASKLPNHGAVYIGGGMMGHHPMNRLSCREIWGGWWRKNTCMVLRYKKK